MEGRIPNSGISQRSRKLPICPPRQQSRPRTSSDLLETSPAVVPTEERNPLLRNVSQRGAERGASVREHRAQRPEPTKSNRRPLQWIPRSDQADEQHPTKQQRRLLRLLKYIGVCIYRQFKDVRFMYDHRNTGFRLEQDLLRIRSCLDSKLVLKHRTTSFTKIIQLQLFT